MGLLKFAKFLLEKDVTYPKAKPQAFVVDYFVKTPKGSSARFSRRTGLTQINGARSETAVRSYLQRLHPGTDIQIQTLDFE